LTGNIHHGHDGERNVRNVSEAKHVEKKRGCLAALGFQRYRKYYRTYGFWG
jgi:hypothetical protein